MTIESALTFAGKGVHTEELGAGILLVKAYDCRRCLHTSPLITYTKTYYIDKLYVSCYIGGVRGDGYVRYEFKRREKRMEQCH